MDFKKRLFLWFCSIFDEKHRRLKGIESVILFIFTLHHMANKKAKILCLSTKRKCFLQCNSAFEIEFIFPAECVLNKLMGLAKFSELP